MQIRTGAVATTSLVAVLVVGNAGTLRVDAAVSASEPRIVFESDSGHVGADGTDRNLIDLWVMDANGRNRQRLTRNKMEESGPACSADGSQVAYAMRHGGNTDIYVMPTKGGPPRAITRNRSLENAPAWSPDGASITYVRWGESGSGDLYVVAADGTNRRVLVGGRTDDRWPRWSPLGDRIAFIRENPADDYRHGLFVVDAKGGEPRRLFSNVYDDTFSWSPDGSMIALTRPSKADYEVPTVWIVNVKTGRQRQLPGQEISRAAWSPDGTTIAVNSELGIRLIPVDRRYRGRQLFPATAGWFYAPAWCR